MSQYLPFVVIGLTEGSVYALAAIGLVVTYKTSRIFNFALGSLSAVAVLLFYGLVYPGHLPWRLAGALTVLGLGPVLGVGFELLGRRLTPLTTEAKVLATIGLSLFISGAITLWGHYAFGTGTTTRARPELPSSLVHVLGVNIGLDQIIIVGVGLVTVVLLHLILEHTSIGSQMLAVADDSDLLALAGRNPITAQRAAWGLGVSFITLAGLLLVLSPNYSVSVATLYLLVLQAFGAAAIGGFISLPLTYIGALMLGVVGALSTDLVGSHPILAGLPSALPFIVLFVVLIAFPRRVLTTAEPSRERRRLRVMTTSRFWQVPLGTLTIATVLVVPFSKNVHVVYASNEALGYGIIFLGLGLLVRTSGQVSLCQMGLAAVGAALFAHLGSSFGVPWFASVVIGGLGAAVVGAIVAVPAIRVAGIYLAVATYGFGVLLEQLLYPTKFLFGTGDLTAPRPAVGPLNTNDDVTYFFVAALLFLLSVLVVTAVRRARLGRLLRALGDSPVALAAQGASVNVARVMVFAISAFLAGVGGAVLTAQNRFLLEAPFASFNSITIIAVLLTLRLAAPLAALLAAASYVLIPSFLSVRGSIWWLDIGFGTAAVASALAGSATWLPRWRWTPRTPAAVPVRLMQPERSRPSGSCGDVLVTEAPRGLEVVDLTVRFKSVVAVDDLTLAAPMCRITGLIGPNGAGKTTTFDFCSGLVQGRAGQLFLHGRDITSFGTPARARAGLGRTFQRVSLFDSMTVRENVELGREGAMAGAHALSHIAASPRQAALVRGAAVEAIDLVGIGWMADRDVRSLSTGEKRLVEMARCLAGRFEVLLLDEPSSGLDSGETTTFGEMLRRSSGSEESECSSSSMTCRWSRTSAPICTYSTSASWSLRAHRRRRSKARR